MRDAGERGREGEREGGRGEGRTDHGRGEDGGGEEDVSLHVEWLVGEEELLYHLSADEELEGEGGEHVQPETEPRDVDEGIVLDTSVSASEIGEDYIRQGR